MRRRMMMKDRSSPKSNHTSMSFMYAVVGSFEDTDWFKVYITSMLVIAIGMLVLKCSFLK